MLLATSAGSPMVRRGFLIVTRTALVDATAVWSGLVGTPTAGKTYPRIGTEVVTEPQAGHCAPHQCGGVTRIHVVILVRSIGRTLPAPACVTMPP